MSFFFYNVNTINALNQNAAQLVSTVENEGFDTIKYADKIGVYDPNTGELLVKDTAQYYASRVKDWAIDKAWVELKNSGDVAWRQALKFFLNTLAYDTATYLATGDKGQLPMFETKGWGGYLTDVADNTAGSFIESLGSNMSTIKFNLCSPNPSVMLKINLGLSKTYRPKAPSCSFSTLVNNWDEALKDKDFLPKFQDMFNPWSNDLGIALTLQTGIESEISNKVNSATQDRIEGQGWRPVRSAIEGRIQTPADLVGVAARQPIQDSTASEKIHTGTILADSIDIFINTLAGKLMDKWLKKGLVNDFPSTVRWNSLSDPNAQNQTEGVAGAQNRFASITEPNFKVRGDYNILSELTMCPNPNKAGPTNCVIDEKFRQAIEKRLTVGQAMDQGYLNANGVFGFTSDGLEPKYNEGYPYRSMLILRKFRILPVGWEVAAQKIKDQQAGGTKNLKNLVDCFSDASQPWCFGLVDPNWVLAAPQNFCKKEGAGPEILSSQVSGEGSASSLNVLRNDTYCADEQSCIKNKSDGSCQQYGYCTEERRTWDFNGKSCAPIDNTCQTFSVADSGPSASSGQIGQVSYLQNTLDYGVCNVGNAGCGQYATTGTYANGSVVWSNAASQQIYLNKNAASCDAADEGCHGFIRNGATVYEKLLPSYLESYCYKNITAGSEDYGFKTDVNGFVSDICLKFARKCNQSEVGCELYTDASDGTKIPAIAAAADACPAECVGYNTFVQKETFFENNREAYFIPKTAKTCSAEAAGCDQFTNLDEAAKGGEGIEYYASLRQCVKPNTPGAACGQFYSWEGSDESGYQLKVISLESGSDGGPFLTVQHDDNKCGAAIYNLPPSNPAYNPDCRQFYDRAGGVFYELYSSTKDCTDNCHPYRRTAADDTAANCAGHGGVWNAQYNACVYMAVPKAGATCSAAASGCREYAGNTGNDSRIIFTDDFEADLTAGGWNGANNSKVERTNVSILLQNNAGHSLLVSANGGLAGAMKTVGSAVAPGRSYVLSFLAKAAGDTTLNISLSTSTNGLKAAFTPVTVKGTDWQIKKTNLTSLDHAVTADEFLKIEANQNFYIDNIILTEITDRYYLIKNSWNTPLSCDADQTDNLPGAALGCSQYTDRANKSSYLTGFSQLCSESSVGCEKMTDTKNSTDSADDDPDFYAVYDKSKVCGAAQKGCALLGKQYSYENTTLYGDVYLKNDPDKYDTIQCSAEAVGCQAFAYDGGEKFFKDPGDQVCEYRRAANQGDSLSWYKKKVNRCGGDGGTVCLDDTDCAAGVKCQLETKDNSCPLDTDNGGMAKTLGIGGVGGRVSQPGADSYGKWAGVCAAASSGCGEYIDPKSQFNTNLIFNGSFQTLASGPTDGWDNLKQNVTLEPNTVYRLARTAAAGSLTLSGCPNALYAINTDNSLSVAATGVTLSAAAYDSSKTFYYKGAATASCTVSVSASTGAVELKPAVIDYQLKQNLDTTSCNGTVDFNKGCVLFNQRSRDGDGLVKLTYDANTANGSPAAAGITENSNAILKVTPDRTCDKWLACKSYIKDDKGNNTCFDVGLCDAMDDKGDCASFLNSAKTNLTVGGAAGQLSADKISNLSGYATAGLPGGSIVSDYYPFGAMAQFGDVANLANGGFEFYGSNLYPVGWNWGGADKSWDANVFSVVNNPIAAQSEGIGNAPEGRAFLKLGSSYDATSEEIDVMPNSDYIITAYVNTKNLKSGQATINISDGTGAVITWSENGIPKTGAGIIKQDLGNDWQFQVGKFRTGANSRIKIKLYASVSSSAMPGSEGNFYFDDIKIRPALNSRDSWYTTQSCRLYPKSDSLACDYYEDSGNRQKGWYGYCLQYDRAPGDPNSCLLWYPIDKVKGDGIEEGAGYQGKAPVYYCTNTVSNINIPSVAYDSQYKPNNKSTNIFWADQTAHGDLSSGFTVDYSKLVTPGGSYEIRNAVTNDRGPEPKILSNNFDMLKIGGFADGPESEGGYSFDLYDTSTNEKVFSWSGNIDITLTIIFTRVDAYCSQLVKTVTEVGQNKYWSSKVYQGSATAVNCGTFDLNNMNFSSSGTCGYDSNYTPFGSINTSSLNMFNPYDWDDNQNAGIQPLTFMNTKSNPKVINYHNQSTLRTLFAQSYGVWNWIGDGANGRYTPNDSLNWPISGGNPPTVTNVKINGSLTGANLTKNGFVNLTFNTKVDSNQLPLTMYSVDWGDGQDAKTTVTGVQMRDRQDPAPNDPNNDGNPHSLYHLYSYWDLKAKDNQNKLSNGDCGSDSQGNYCRIKPSVQIKDNWGWYNKGTAINIAPADWENFGGYVVVREK